MNSSNVGVRQQWINEWMNEWMNESINRSIDQSINQSMMNWTCDQKLAGSQFSVPHESNWKDNWKDNENKTKNRKLFSIPDSVLRSRQFILLLDCEVNRCLRLDARLVLSGKTWCRNKVSCLYHSTLPYLSDFFTPVANVAARSQLGLYGPPDVI